jgi:hypothetical protein
VADRPQPEVGRPPERHVEHQEQPVEPVQGRDSAGLDLPAAGLAVLVRRLGVGAAAIGPDRRAPSTAAATATADPGPRGSSGTGTANPPAGTSRPVRTSVGRGRSPATRRGRPCDRRGGRSGPAGHRH